MMARKQCCANCEFWDIDRAPRTPKGNLPVDVYSKCLWVDRNIPDSVRGGYCNGPYPMRMRKDSGTTCPCYTERKDDAK